MRYRALTLGLFLVVPPLLRAAEVLDRIVVAVNGHAILQSDWQDEIRYESFIAGRLPVSSSAADRKAALDRLIDRELLREQAGAPDLTPPGPEEIENQFASVKEDYARTNPSQSWSDALSSYGLTETDIKNHIALELSQLRLIDAHLRPSIQVDPDEISAYYRNHPPPSTASGKQISLQEETPQIRELLTQQKMNDLLNAWLDSLHSQAEIRIFVQDSSDTQGWPQ